MFKPDNTATSKTVKISAPFRLDVAQRQNDEEQHRLFLLKKRIVDTLVHQATIDRNREVIVEIRLNLLAILDEDAKSTMLKLAYISKGEIYTHIRSGRVHHHRCAFCG
jgi:hypothetical protein